MGRQARRGLPGAGALDAVRARGVRIALDDVGAGFSNVEVIEAIGPDFLKIAGGLATGSAGNPRRGALIGALVAYARACDCRIIAEGVETAADLAFLGALDVEYVQGRLIGAPAALGQASDAV